MRFNKEGKLELTQEEYQRLLEIKEDPLPCYCTQDDYIDVFWCGMLAYKAVFEDNYSIEDILKKKISK